MWQYQATASMAKKPRLAGQDHLVQYELETGAFSGQRAAIKLSPKNTQQLAGRLYDAPGVRKHPRHLPQASRAHDS